MSYQPIPNPLPVSGTVTTTPSGTQTVSGTVTANAGSGTFAVSGPLTDAQLRAAVVPVSLTSTTVTNTVAVSGPLTDTQLRAAAVPISDGGGSVTVDGTVAISGTVTIQESSSLTVDAPVAAPVFVRLSDGTSAISTLPVSGPLTDTQLRATAVPVSQSGTWNIGTVTTLPSIPTGTNIIGRVGIDQSTPGTTNAVSLTHIGSTAYTGGQGVSTAGSPRIVLSGDSVSGTIVALNGAQTLNTVGFAGVAIDLRGTFTATVTFQGTIDGTTFFSLQATPFASASNVAPVTTAAAAGAWLVACAGCTQVRAIATAFTSGTITATLRATVDSPWTYQAAVGATQAISGSLTSAGTTTNTPATPTASIINSAATTNATSVKATAGTIYSITVSNAGAAAAFVKLYNLATAPTVGTSVIALTIPVAASGVVTIPFGSQGMRFGTGIALAITNLVAEADATAVAANQVKVLTSYI